MSGYSPILELGDDPITPREKVRQIIDGALNSAIPEPWEVANHATDAILTALASGSGDHAELAKRLRSSKRERHGIYGRVLVNPDGPAAAASLEALLAEIAALRDREKAALKECSEWARKAGEAIGKLETSEAAGIVEGWQDRATEAERKLAEAVGLLSEVADEFGCTIEQYHKNGPHWTSADGEMFDVGVILDREPIIERIRTFLSKEAERG